MSKCFRSDLHRKGAEEYFSTSMKLCRLIRKILGKDGAVYISESGDCLKDPVPFSQRLKAIKMLRNSSQPVTD